LYVQYFSSENLTVKDNVGKHGTAGQAIDDK